MADHKFKSLEKLVLDFSDWALSVDEGLVVCQPTLSTIHLLIVSLLNLV